MSDDNLPTNEQIMAYHQKLDDIQIPVIYDLAVKRDWGFGRIIQICHQLWDKSLRDEWGIHNHERSYTLAGAMVILEQEAQKNPEHAKEFTALHDALADAMNKMSRT